MTKRPPINQCIRRRDDMSQNSWIQLVVDEDGDVGLMVYDCEKESISDVEFCIPGSGGGKSPKTHEALRNLAAAIIEDGNEFK